MTLLELEKSTYKNVLTFEEWDVNIINDQAKRSAKRQNKKLFKKV